MPATPSTGQSVRSGTLGSAEMGVTVRRLGIDAVPGVPWGTHFCQFYETSQDLVDILVPYFQAGLEQNELCMWVTSEPLHAAQAKAALQPALPGLDDYLRQGQLEILDYSQWYTPSGSSTRPRARRLDREEQQALSAGLRAAARRAYVLAGEERKDFADYESAVDNAVSRRRVALQLSIQKCTATEVIDIVNNRSLGWSAHGPMGDDGAAGGDAEEEAAHRNAVLKGSTTSSARRSAATPRADRRLCNGGRKHHRQQVRVHGETNLQTGLLMASPSAIRLAGMPDDRSVRPRHGPLHGIYGRVLQDGKGLHQRSLLASDGIGTPEGHPPLTAFLGVPLTHDGQTIGMVPSATARRLPRRGSGARRLGWPHRQALMRRRAEEQINSSTGLETG